MADEGSYKPRLAADRGRAPLGSSLSRYTGGFLVAMGLLVLSGLAAFWSTVRLSETRALLQRSYDIKAVLDDTDTSLNKVQSARLAHVLDPRPRHRQHFVDAKMRLEEDLAKLGSLITVQEQQRRLSRLRSLIAKRMRFLNRSMDAEAVPTDAEQRAISEESEATSQAIRTLIAEMQVATDAIRKERQVADRSVQRWATWASSGSLLAGFVILSIGFIWIARLVGERERAVSGLKESEARFRAGFEVATIGKAQIDPRTGFFVRVNRKLCDMTGYDEAELLGMTTLELTHPDDRERDRQAIRLFVQGTVAQHEAEMRCVRKNGTTIWVSVTASMIRDAEGSAVCAVCTIIDITARRRAEEILRERALVASVKADVASALGRGQALPDLLRAALEQVVERLEVASIQVWTVDPSRSHLELTAMVGSPPREPERSERLLFGEGLIGRVATTRRPHVRSAIDGDQAESGAAWVAAERRAAFAGYPLLLAGEVVGVLAIFARRELPTFALDAFSDVAEEIARAVDHDRTDLERAVLLRTTQQARVDAEAASRAKDDFLSILSHELRTPLNAVLGWTELLRMGAIEAAEVDQALETIEQNALRQSRLISDILDVSRIVEGRLKLDTAPCRVADVVEAAVDTVRHAAVAKSIELEIALGETPEIVLDATRIQQVLWNLLSNAIKFTPKGGTVRVELGDAGSHVRIVVSDTGCGISSGFLPHLFERFTQEDVSSTREQGGLGLGMAIVRHLVELHGGSVTAESPGPDRGASFLVRLPYSPGTAADARAREEVADDPDVAPAGGARPLSDLRVLVVDDERDTLTAVERALGFFGACVVTATSAADALAKLSEHPPDVLVSDVAMPGEDGYSLIQKVRSRPPDKGGAVPAVALTAFAGAEDRRRLLAAGFQVHLPKPVEPRRLVSTITQLVG
jgi:PAS domain S-box-containing protein